MLRLNKYIATNLGVSRRGADNLISAGKVLVNNKPAEIGARVTEKDTVVVDGKKIVPEKLIYLALNKPAGYVCSRKRQGDTPTMYELLPEKYQALKSVGRLDKDSSGLILLTNDGDFAFRMTHPSFVKIKIYEVALDRALEPLHQQMIADFGVQLPDGRSQLGLEKLNEERTEWRVTMSEGRNRQIRRTFDALGYKVVALHRTNFGNYKLAGLESGKFEEVSRAD
ncbi:rRNA pseudouridine synthase [Candidatus Saccharibacteria bacterium]|nr:rRNA pseudouridine synthase [Candidatus Saccharibacteria bacterium]MBR3377718.1 rRNA pseudouridine synthase [Candidatus Saccharibacteria bacterium]